MEQAIAPVVCCNHAANVADLRCGRCSRPICGVCAFDTPAGAFCPDCMVSGAQGSQSPALAFGSIGLAVLSTVVMVVTLAFAAGRATDKTAATAVGVVLMVAAAGAVCGLTLAMIARERARGSSSPVTMVGIILNALLIAAHALLTLAGTLRA